MVIATEPASVVLVMHEWLGYFWKIITQRHFIEGVQYCLIWKYSLSNCEPQTSLHPSVHPSANWTHWNSESFSALGSWKQRKLFVSYSHFPTSASENECQIKVLLNLRSSTLFSISFFTHLSGISACYGEAAWSKHYSAK